MTCALVTACRACENAGRGVKHHWFHECHGGDPILLPQPPPRCPYHTPDHIVPIPNVGRLQEHHILSGLDCLAPMGTYCTHYRKLALWVGYTPVDGLKTEACRYLFQLWGLGYSRSFLKGAVSTMHALEEMGWLPEFVTGKVWRCAKWATSQAVARPCAGLEELRSFARASDGRAQWTAYGMALLSFTYIPQVGKAAPMTCGGSRARGLGFHTVKCDPHFVRRKRESYGRAWLR